MTIAKLINESQVETTWMDDEDPILQSWLDGDWKPFVGSPTRSAEGEFQKLTYKYADIDGVIQQTATIAPDAAAEIAWNKQQLAEADWKTTRNTIAERAGAPLPIAWDALYAETQAYRDRINELE